MNFAKLGLTAVIIVFVILLSGAVVISVNRGEFALTIALTCVFLILATVMNRIIDSYGD